MWSLWKERRRESVGGSTGGGRETVTSEERAAVVLGEREEEVPGEEDEWGMAGEGYSPKMFSKSTAIDTKLEGETWLTVLLYPLCARVTEYI